MDRALGDGLEWTLRRHHRRRLAKLGWGGAFEPGDGPWVTGHTPERAGNALAVHVDGEEAFNAISKAIRSARSFVHLAGWHMEPDFILNEQTGETLEDLLVEAGSRVDVRILLWGGAPLPPPFRPRRAEAKELAARLSGHEGVQASDRLQGASASLPPRKNCRGRWTARLRRRIRLHRPGGKPAR